MKKIVINQTFAADYFEDFHEMTGTELARFYGCAGNRCGIYDEEAHTAIIVTWTKPKLAFLTDERSVLKGAEMQLKRNLQDYRHVETLNTEIAGCQAIGNRFEYTVNGTDIVQYGDLYVFKYNKLYYGIQLIARKEGFDASQKEMERFLQSVALIG